MGSPESGPNSVVPSQSQSDRRAVGNMPTVRRLILSPGGGRALLLLGVQMSIAGSDMRVASLYDSEVLHVRAKTITDDWRASEPAVFASFVPY